MLMKNGELYLVAFTPGGARLGSAEAKRVLYMKNDNNISSAWLTPKT